MLLPVLAAMAVIIVVVLAWVAWRLQQKVKQQEQQRHEQQLAEQEEQRKQRAYLTESIQVIALNAVQKDLNLSEATIRCKVLLDALFLSPQEREHYAILEYVYEQVSQFATHQARKQLTKTERQRQDAEREKIEEDNREALMACFTVLAERRLK